MAFKICLMERIIRSHAPPMWLTEGGLKIHSIFFLSAEIADLVFIPLFDSFFQLLICLCEVTSLIASYLLWIATNANESSKGINH